MAAPPAHAGAPGLFVASAENTAITSQGGFSVDVGANAAGRQQLDVLQATLEQTASAAAGF